jgi:hypothetical protein
MNRTKHYKFTVNMENGSPVGDTVETLRKQISEANKTSVKKRYIKLQARGPRAVHSLRDFGNSWRYDMFLPMKYAVTADVYVYNR